MIKSREFVERVELQPAALERYVHFFAKISALWGYAECKKLLDGVMLDDRGGRQGFSPEAMSEIAFLSALCDMRYSAPNGR